MHGRLQPIKVHPKLSHLAIPLPIIATAFVVYERVQLAYEFFQGLGMRFGAFRFARGADPHEERRDDRVNRTL